MRVTYFIKYTARFFFFLPNPPDLDNADLLKWCVAYTYLFFYASTFIKSTRSRYDRLGSGLSHLRFT